MTRSYKIAPKLIVLLGFLLVYLLPLGVHPITIPDESRYAEIPREMIASGDWVVPHLMGVRYFEKPVLGDWMTAASMLAFGQNAFAYRFVPATATAGAALMIYALLSRFGGGRRNALFGVVIFLTCVEVWALGLVNVLDALFSMLATGTLICFFFAHRSGSPKRRILWLAGCGVCCGLAFLAKGFLAFAFPALTIGPFLFWERRWKDFLTLPWIPTLSALFAALPWCISVGLRESDFWHYFFWVQHVRRFFGTGGAQHSQPFWFFVPVFLGGALPWTLVSPSAFRGVRAAATRDSLVRFAICWLVVPVLFLSASRGKLGTYILPCFPAFAILMALGLARSIDEGAHKAFRVGAVICSVVTLTAALVLVAVQCLPLQAYLKPFGVQETWKWIATAVGLVAAGGITALAGRGGVSNRGVYLFAVAPLPLLFAVHFTPPERLLMGECPGPFLERNRAAAASSSILVSDDYLGPAVCSYYQRTDIHLVGRGELTYGLGYPDAAGKYIEPERLKDFIAAGIRAGAVAFFLDPGRFGAIRARLPEPDRFERFFGFVYLEYLPHPMGRSLHRSKAPG